MRCDRVLSRRRLSSLILFVCLLTVALGFTSDLLLAEGADGQAELSSQDVSAGWLRLYDGATLFGWNSSGPWQTRNNLLTCSMTDCRLISAVPFADFTLRFDYRINATPSGAALRLRTSRDGEPAENGYRVPLGDSVKDWPPGSIVERSRSSAAYLPLNQWHSVKIEARGSHIEVQIDGNRTAETTDEASKGGHLVFESTRGSIFELRNPRLLPLNVNHVFNGTDLSGWKSIAYTPQPGGGNVLKPIEHMFGAGGAQKPHSATWTVKSGAIHGEKGPGALETTNQYDNFILQITAAAAVNPKKEKDAFPAIYLRGDPGAIGNGYAVGVGDHTGVIQSLAQPRRAVPKQGAVSQTILVSGRQVAIWVDGNLTTLFTDTRPEAATTRQGAKVRGGVISIPMPPDLDSVDYRDVAVASMPRDHGGLVKHQEKAPETAALPPPVQMPSATSQAEQSAQLAAALGVPTPEVRSRTADLMSRAVRSTDPSEQMRLYDEVIRLDPGNAAAVQGFKEAQSKLDQSSQQQQQQVVHQQQQQVASADRNQQIAGSLTQAQSAFMAGRLREADRSLQLAERLAPSNPLVRDLRSRISAATSLRHRLVYLGSGAGLLALLGGGGFFLRHRRQQRYAVLMVVQGLDKGRRYPLDKDLVKIGAVPQDGGQKNDLVVRDVEHMVSRFHCEVRRRDGNLYLVDMNSSNGTRVDSERAQPGQPVLLRRGARIDMGGTVVLRLGYDRRRRA